MENKEMVKHILEMLRSSLLFDEEWYRETYQIPRDEDAVVHYLLKGWKIGNNPSRYFNTYDYLSKYPDIEQAKACPLLHYELYGLYEGRFHEELEAYREKIMEEHPECKDQMEGGMLRIRITNKCNGKCRFCGLLAWDEEQRNRVMNPRWYYEYFKPLYEKVNTVLLTGGDAFVAPESYNFIKFLGENYPHITIFSESNGLAFDKKFQVLAADNLQLTHFSLNGSTSEIFERGCWSGTNGKVAWNKMIDNVKSYLKLLEERDMGCFAPNYSMVINRDTADDVVDFMKLCLKLKCSFVSYYFDYTESYMYGDYFGCPEPSRKALKTLLEMERVLEGKVYIEYSLWIPLKEKAPLEKEVAKEDIVFLNEKYADILCLAEGRNIKEEWEQRNELRRAHGKHQLTWEEDFSLSLYSFEINCQKECAAPWKMFDIYPDGKYAFCSWVPAEMNLNNYITNDAIEWDCVLNSVEYMTIRNHMLHGNYGKCMPCCPLYKCKS